MKSYLSKQIVAVIVIVTVLIIAIPCYFFVLAPMFERGDKGDNIVPPHIEGETIDRNGAVYINRVEENEEEQEYFFGGAGTAEWSFYIKGDSLFIREYENAPTDGTMVVFLHNAAKNTLASSRIAPTVEALEALRKEKADKMDEAELEAAGGINSVVLTNEEAKQAEINFADFGLGDPSACKYIRTTDKNGKTHTIYLGNVSPDGGSRYAMYEGRHAVYLLSESIVDFLDITPLSVISPMLTVLPANAESDYVPEVFEVRKDGEVIASIRTVDADKVLDMGLSTLSVLYKEIEPEVYNTYDTSAKYTSMLYERFRSSIYGSEVVAMAKAEVAIEDGNKVFKAGTLTAEELAEFGIVRDRNLFIYEKDSITNYLSYSDLKTDENGKKFYYVLNDLYEFIVKVDADKLPFLSWQEADYISTYASMVYIHKLHSLKIDSSLLRDKYLNPDRGFVRVNETFYLEYKKNGNDYILDADGSVILQNIKQANGEDVKAPTDVSGNPAKDDSNQVVTGVGNFRRLYNKLISIRMYINVEDQIDEIRAHEESGAPADVTVNFSMEGDLKEHVLRFYFYENTGTLCYYTYDNNQSRYVISAEDLGELLESVVTLKEGALIELDPQ